jgi:serine/threonine-protein kinase HipA
MIEMKLDVRLDGFADPIGTLSKDENSALSFNYATSYLDNRTAHPLSLSLPLTSNAYDDARARPFFENLLQERGLFRFSGILAGHLADGADDAGMVVGLAEEPALNR